MFDFYDRLKSISSGYASFDYEIDEYIESDLVRLSILVNDESVDALSIIVHRSFLKKRSRCLRKTKRINSSSSISYSNSSSNWWKNYCCETVREDEKMLLREYMVGATDEKKNYLIRKRKTET